MIHIKSKNGLYAHLLSGIREEIIFHGSVKVVIITDRFITVHGEDVCCGWLSNVRPQANELNQNNNSCVVSEKLKNRENGKVTIMQGTKCHKIKLLWKASWRVAVYSSTSRLDEVPSHSWQTSILPVCGRVSVMYTPWSGKLFLGFGKIN